MKNSSHPSERTVGDELRRVSARAGLRGMAARLACHGPSVSKSASSQATTSVSENAQMAQGGSLNVRDSGPVASGAGAGSTPAAVHGDRNVTSQQTGSGNTQTLAGNTIQGNQGTVTITTADPLIVSEALNKVSELAAGGADLFAQAQTKTDALLAALAESKATEGASSLNKNIVIVSLGALAVLAYVTYIKRT